MTAAGCMGGGAAGPEEDGAPDIIGHDQVEVREDAPVSLDAPGLDDFECTPCSGDQDCTDTIFCNGREFCNLETGCCETSPACETPADPCMMLRCVEEVQTCVEGPLDADGDGYTIISATGPSGEDVPCGGSDCDDRNADIHPGAPDGCGDMLDSDCDFIADEDGWRPAGTAVPLSWDGAGVTDADILKAGERWVVAWSETVGGSSSLRAGLYDAATEGPDVPPSDPLDGSAGAGEVEVVAASTGEAAVIWIEGGQSVKGMKLGLTGGIQQQTATALWVDPAVPSDMSDLDVVAEPDGSHAGIFFRSRRDGNFEVYMLRVDLSGFGPEGVTGPVRVSRAVGFSGYPSAATDGDKYIVAWEDERDGNKEIYFRKVGILLPVEEPEVRITAAPGDSRYPSISGSAEGYFMVWMDESGGPFNILAARLDGSAVPVDFPLAMGAGEGARVYPRASPDPRGEDFGLQKLILYSADDGLLGRLFLTGVGERSSSLQPGMELYSTSKDILGPVLSEGLDSRAAVWLEWDYSGGKLYLLNLGCQ